jgi:hypothetical protein
MENTSQTLSEQDRRSAARGFGFLTWGFVFLLYVGFTAPLGAVRVLVPPPTVGWLLFLVGLALLPAAPRVAAARTWALGALILSVPAGFVVPRLEQAHQWYGVLRTGALLANYLVGVGAVVCLMGFVRNFARRHGAGDLAEGARLRQWLFLASALMPLAHMLANRAIEADIVAGLWPVLIPPVLSIACITAIVSYMGALVRLCTGTGPQRTRPAAHEEHEPDVKDLWDAPPEDEAPAGDDGTDPTGT